MAAAAAPPTSRPAQPVDHLAFITRALPRVEFSTLSEDLRASSSARFCWTIVEPAAVMLGLAGITVSLVALAATTSDASEAKGAYLNALRIVGIFALLYTLALTSISTHQRNRSRLRSARGGA